MDPPIETFFCCLLTRLKGDVLVKCPKSLGICLFQIQVIETRSWNRRAINFKKQSRSLYKLIILIDRIFTSFGVLNNPLARVDGNVVDTLEQYALARERELIPTSGQSDGRCDQNLLSQVSRPPT
mgnify:FL=1